MHGILGFDHEQRGFRIGMKKSEWRLQMLRRPDAGAPPPADGGQNTAKKGDEAEKVTFHYFYGKCFQCKR